MKKSNFSFNKFFLFVSITFLMHSLSFAQNRIPVMLLTGESNPYHPWEPTTSALEKILNETGLFTVDVVIVPQVEGELTDFMPNFADYSVIVFNYDAPSERWPEALKKSFEQYMNNGGGLVSIHAADNAFTEWSEYNKMIGIGGWRDRTEEAGPYWYYKDGKLVSDKTPGRAGNHGRRIPFKMEVVNRDHPITIGLPSSWMHQGDELYSRLRGPGDNMNVLVTAYSDPNNNGTGFDEPQLIALPYGKGRVFHYTPGHDVLAMSSVDYIVLLQRGTEWAATGKVTQQLPDDFPTVDTVSYRVNIAEIDPAYKNGLNSPMQRPNVAPNSQTQSK